MLINLLAESESGSNWTSYIWIIVLLVLVVAFFVWSFISQKKKQKAYTEQINAVKPGCKVKTIGGVVGEVVEVNEEDGTFVLRTGDSEGNYSYMRFDRQAIYQTLSAAAAETPAAQSEPAQEEQAPAEEAQQEEAAEEKKDETEDK